MQRSAPESSACGPSGCGPSSCGPADDPDQRREPADHRDGDPGGRPRVTPLAQLSALQGRLASWLTDLTALQELTERVARTDSLDTALRELLRAGAALVGAERGVAVLRPADGRGPDTSVGLGLAHCDLGTLETVPLALPRRGGAPGSAPPGGGSRWETGHPGARVRAAGREDADEPAPWKADGGAQGEEARSGQAEDGDARDGEAPGGQAPDGGTRDAEARAGGGRDGDLPSELIHPDIAADRALPPRHREVAAQLGIAASYALRLATEATGPLGTVVWMYDQPAAPTERQRRLAALYCSFASELVAKQLRLARVEREARALREALLPARLPLVPGVRLGVRHRCGAEGGGDWYDALVLPEGGLGLSVGGVTGKGPGAAAAMGRLRTSLRAYAVMEGEDPVAVLSDLELLLHLTEPARSATALFVHTEPARRRLVLAGAGHCPPLLVGDRRVELVETALSAPLGMLSCWEAPSAELSVEPGETLVLYTDGLLHRSGGTLDQAFARLRGAGAHAPREAREDPGLLCDHLLAACLPDGAEQAEGAEDIVLLAVRFD